MKLAYKIVFIFLMSITISLNAQEDVLRPDGRADANRTWKKHRFTIGLDVGANLNFFSQTQNWYESVYIPFIPTAYDCNKSAFGVSPTIGFLVDVPIDTKFGFQGRIAYNQKNYGNSGSGLDMDYNGRVHDINYEWDAKSSYLSFQTVLRYNFTPNLFITGGFLFDFLMGDLEVTQTAECPDGTAMSNFIFWNFSSSGQAVTNKYTMKYDNTRKKDFRFGLELGVGYKIPISKDWWLVPQARGHFYLSPAVDDYTLVYTNPINAQVIPIVSNDKRNLHSVQLLLSLWYDL